MGVTILPFAADHVEPAAALLAARHRRGRTVAPALPSEYEDPAATLPIVRDLVAAGGMRGVVAIEGGRLAGYLLGAPEPEATDSLFAGFMPPRAADIPFAGHATAPGQEAIVYPRLYAALAQRWVADGLLGHYVSVPAAPDEVNAWVDLGFGRFIAMGARDTVPPAEPVAASAAIEVRRATPADEDVVVSLATELFRTFADPPIFVPYLPETTAAVRRLVADRLADPACPHWLAVTDGRAVALQMFEEPRSPFWHHSPMQSPRRAVYLFLACTVQDVRGTGVGTALFAQTMAWARAAGYDCCLAHYLTASRAARFWHGLGFRPVSQWMRRIVDERAA